MSGNYVVRHNILLVTEDKEEVLADVYMPVKREELTSALILIHGGAWQAGSKEMYKEWGPFLAQNGFLAMAIDYRLSTVERSTWPGVLNDVRAAYNWIMENANELRVDTSRIGLIGDSCGAQLSIMLALENLNKGNIKTIIGVYGVYDLTEWWEYTQKARDDDPVGKFIGKTPLQDPRVYQEASPIYQINQLSSDTNIKNINFFLIWGDADIVVPPEQSEKFCELLQQNGFNLEKLILPGFGHFWFTPLPGKPGGGLHDEPNLLVSKHLLNYLQKNL